MGGFLIYSLIIADDEEIECKALSMLIKKNFSEIQLLPYVLNGADLIDSVGKSKPDIAIVDINMAGINGLDAIDLIKLKDIHLKVIINTAYNTFEYVQKALSLGADDYILKPERREHIIATISKLCRTIEDERQKKAESEKLGQLVSDMIPIMESEIISSILLGKPNKKNFNSYCNTLKVSFQAGTFFTVRLYEENEPSSEEHLSAVASFLKNEMNLVCTNMSSSLLHGDLYFFVIIPPGTNNPDAWTVEAAQLIMNQVYQQFGFYLTCGIGKIYLNFEQMPKAYQESILALNCRPVAKNVNLYAGPGTGPDPDFSLDLLQQDLIENIKSCNPEGCRACVHRGLSNQKNPDLKKLRAGLMDLMLSINNELLQSNVVYYGKAIPYQEFSEQIERLDSPQQVEDWLQDAIRQILTSIQAENRLSINGYVMQAVEYVNQNYARDISLDCAAEAIGISPFYLSRLFKQELKQNFVEYLTEIRMKRAVWLVEHTRMSIKEISRQVGYDNPTYFCKVFKKSTGRTLREIREQQWKNQF